MNNADKGIEVCTDCKIEKLVYPEGALCPICQITVIMKLAKKYHDIQMNIKR